MMFRVVSSNDGKRMACCQLDIQFHECSTAKGWENIEFIFKEIIRKVKIDAKYLTQII